MNKASKVTKQRKNAPICPQEASGAIYRVRGVGIPIKGKAMKFNKKQLPFYAAAVQTIQYSFGGFLYFSWIGVPIVGSMGALISFSTAYAASQINDIAKGRKVASWFAMVGLMALSPVIIGTSLFYSLDVIQNPVWRGVVSAVWGILPDGATALAGFIAGKGMMSEPQKTAQQTGATPKIRSAKNKSAQQVACKWGCGQSGTQAAMNAHSSHCSKNPAKQLVDMVNTK